MSAIDSQHQKAVTPSAPFTADNMRLLRDVTSKAIDSLNNAEISSAEFDLFRPLYRVHDMLGAYLHPRGRVDAGDLRSALESADFLARASYCPHQPLFSGSELGLMLHLAESIRTGSLGPKGMTPSSQEPSTSTSLFSSERGSAFRKALESLLSPGAGHEKYTTPDPSALRSMSSAIIERAKLGSEVARATGAATWSDLSRKFPPLAGDISEIRQYRDKIEIAVKSISELAVPEALTREISVLREALRLHSVAADNTDR